MFKKHLAAAVVGSLVLAGILVAWNSATKVVWFTEAHIVLIEPGKVQMEIEGFKVRDCRYIPGSAVGYIQSIDGRWRESAFRFVDDMTPGNSKPRMFFKRLSFGIWEWKNGNNSPIVATMLTVGHDCRDPDAPRDPDSTNASRLRTTSMGPFPL